MADKITEWAKALQSLAQAGLFYGKDVYDRERYERTDLPMEKVKDLFCNDFGYQTPKVDTRAAIFNGSKILLVRENKGTWSLPGGWCEFNLSPMDNAVKEAKEEAGLNVRPMRLIAVQDRDRHNRPPYAYGVVKIFYLCEALGGQFEANSETTESGWFSLDELPPLAEEKNNREQIEMCFAAQADENWAARFD